jgi:uncharacterized membrane protein YwaF
VQNSLTGLGRFIWEDDSAKYLGEMMLIGTGLCAILLGLRMRSALRIAISCLPVIALMAISHTTAAIPPTEYGKLSWLVILSNVVVLLITVLLGQRDDIVKSFVWAGAIIAVVGGIGSLAVNARLGNRFGYDPLVRESVTGGTATGAYLSIGRSVAMAAAPAIVFCLSEVAVSWYLLVHLGILGFSMALMVAGGGRSPAIGFAMMVVAALAMRVVRISRKRQLVLLLALLLVSGALSTTGPARQLATGQRIEEMASGKDLSAIARWRAKAVCIRLIGESPIIGQGSGTYDAFGGSNLRYPHDLFLELGADYGLPVAVSGLLGCLWLLRSYYRRLRRDALVLSAADNRVQISLYLLLVFWLVQVPFIGMPSSSSLFAVAGLCVGIVVHSHRPSAGRSPHPYPGLR